MEGKQTMIIVVERNVINLLNCVRFYEKRISILYLNFNC